MFRGALSWPLILGRKLFWLVFAIDGVARINVLAQLTNAASTSGLPGLLLYQEKHHHHRHHPKHHHGHHLSHSSNKGPETHTAMLEPGAHEIPHVIFHHKARRSYQAPAPKPEVPMKTAEVQASGSEESGAQMMRGLLDGYDNQEPPSPGDAGEVEYAVAFLANKLVEVDHVAQTMTMVGWVRQYWFDPRLSYEGAASLKQNLGDQSWDSKKDSLPVDPEEIWKPDVKLINALDFNWEELCDSVEAFVYDNSGATTVKVDGGRSTMKYNVFYSRPCVLVTKCNVDLKWYPFDVNTCDLQFMPWHDNFLHMHVASDYLESKISLPEFAVRIGAASVHLIKEWGGYPQADISFIIMRHGDYYVVNYICPVMLLVLLSWVSFFVPHAASDRLAYTLTLLLTLMAVNFITADKRPATDEDMWLDEYQTVTMVLVVIATFYSVMTMRYQPEENWAESRKHERRELLDRVERIARIVFPVVTFLSVGFLFWELHVYSAKYLSLSDHLHSRPAMLVFFIMVIMCCILFYIMFDHWKKKGWKQDQQSVDQQIYPEPEYAQPPPTDQQLYQQQVQLQYGTPGIQQASVRYQSPPPSDLQATRSSIHSNQQAPIIQQAPVRYQSPPRTQQQQYSLSQHVLIPPNQYPPPQ